MQTCCQVPEKMGKRSLRELERQADDDLSYDDETIVAPVTPKKRKVASKEENQKVPRVKRRRQGERVDDIPANQQGGEAASLENIIRQALTSKDRKMLDDALTSSDLLVIRRTISDLATPFVEPLLHQLVSRVLSTPVRMRILGPWIRELLRQHIGFCMNVPKNRQNLERLYQHATIRLRYHSDILKLQGRVEELIYLSQRRLDEKNARREEDAGDEPLLRFKEGTDAVHKPEVLASLVSNAQNAKNTTEPEDNDSGNESFDEFLNAELQ